MPNVSAIYGFADGEQVFRISAGSIETEHYTFDGARRDVSVQNDNGVECVTFAPVCTPENPVYLRFLNTWGGWEYYMFTGRKSLEYAVKRGEKYMLAESDTIDTKQTAQRLAGSVEKTLTAGVEGLPFDEWEWLKGIALAPIVELWNVKRQCFLVVTLKDTTPAYDTETGQGSVEIEIELLDEDWEV